MLLSATYGCMYSQSDELVDPCELVKKEILPIQSKFEKDFKFE
jgi:hypothetical protein